MPRITISYRRDDSGAITGRIFDRLTAHYGRDAIFRDIDNIPPGVDFRKHIDGILDQSDVVLAIVGPRWVGPRGGRSRLENAADPVRVEIETALRKNTPLIPVLVSRGSMPRVEQLPESLRDFAYHNAVAVDTGQDFDVHMARLMRSMDRFFAGAGDARDVGDVVPAATLEAIPTVEPAAPDNTRAASSDLVALRDANRALEAQQLAALTAQREADAADANGSTAAQLRQQVKDLTAQLALAGKAAMARHGGEAKELARAQARIEQLTARVSQLTQELRAVRAAGPGPARRHPAMVALLTIAVLAGGVAALILFDLAEWHRSVLWTEHAVLTARSWWR